MKVLDCAQLGGGSGTRAPDPCKATPARRQGWDAQDLDPEIARADRSPASRSLTGIDQPTAIAGIGADDAVGSGRGTDPSGSNTALSMV